MEHNAFDLTAKPNYKMRPLARIKWWFKSRKYIKERAKRGWSRYDAWDFDTYLAMVIGDALEYLAGSHNMFPLESNLKRKFFDFLRNLWYNICRK